jgi:hypothetical protein
VAEIFRIEKSASLDASIPPFLSFLKWTTKAGAQQDSLKRAFKVWLTRAQKPAKLIGEDDAIDEMAIEEMEPMLSERIQKWSDELIAKGKAEGKAEGRVGVLVELFERKFGLMSDEIRAHVSMLDADSVVRMIERLHVAESPEDVITLDQ